MAELRGIDGGRARRGGKGTPKGEGSYDPFTMNDDKDYKPTNVYARSTDGQGHSTNMQVRVPPTISTEISALIASQVIPEYRTAADFIRDAVIHKMYEVSQRKKLGDLERRVTIQMRLARVEAWQEEMETMQKMEAEQTDTIKKALDLRDMDMVERLLELAQENLEFMRDPYAASMRRNITEFKKDFRRLKAEETKK